MAYFMYLIMLHSQQPDCSQAAAHSAKSHGSSPRPSELHVTAAGFRRWIRSDWRAHPRPETQLPTAPPEPQQRVLDQELIM